MVVTPRCVCCDQALEDACRTPAVALMRCPSCGTWAARHLQDGPAPDVWRGDTVTPEYLEALLRRRRRQAREILDRLRPLRASGRILDYGCGYGLFLEALLSEGYDAHGCDLSPSALEQAAPETRRRMSLCREPWALPEGRFETVCMLDVLEHCETPLDLVGRLRASGAEMLVVKVPVTEGPLFRLAAAVARLGKLGPLEHLFLVGESAPHWSYFSAAGLDRLFRQGGYRTLQRFYIPEVGPELAVRLRGTSGRGNPLASAALGAAGMALERIGGAWSDAAVFICRTD